MPGIRPLQGRTIHVLSESDVDTVHAATLDLLERVGVVVEDAQAIAVLAARGAEASAGRVRFPPSLVERAIASAPHRVLLWARDPAQDVALGEQRIHFTSGYGATFVLDLETDEFRQGTLADMRQAAVLADALDMVHYCLLSVIPQDVPGEAGELAATAMLLATTTKHVGPSLSTARLYPVVLEMARLLAPSPGHLPISLGCTTSSPLTISRDSIARMRICGENRIPFRIVSAPLSGATAPATLAGTLVQQNAEVLAGVTLAQCLNEGAPVVYGTFGAAADMRTGKIALGGPELALLNAASAQLCRRYGIPLGYGTGGTCDSPARDEQAGAERMMTALYAAMAGVEVIHDGVGGLVGSAMCFSPAQMVADNEHCQAIARLLKGIEVTPDTLALDAIAQVGPGGNFLAEIHTLKHYRQEHFLPRTATRTGAAEWYGDPAARTGDRARDAARSILARSPGYTVDKACLDRMESLLGNAGVNIRLQ